MSGVREFSSTDNTFDSLDEMDSFLKRYTLQELIQEEIVNLKDSVPNKEI